MRHLNPFKKSPKKKSSRRRLSSNWLWIKQLCILWGSLAAFGGAGSILYWAHENDAFNRGWDHTTAFIIEQTIQNGLVIDEVFVSNRKTLPSDDLIAALALNLGDSILLYDVEAAKVRVEKLGWVRKATVERQLPDKIYVNIQERTPIAIWQRDKNFTLIDAEGEIIGQEDVKNYGHLKVVVGENAAKNAANLMRLLSEAPELEAHVIAAVWVGNRRWNLHLNNGIDVRLPETNPVKAWAKLAAIQKEHAVLAKDIVAIDMRQPDRLVVKMTGAKTQRLLEISKTIDHEA